MTQNQSQEDNTNTNATKVLVAYVIAIGHTGFPNSHVWLMVGNQMPMVRPIDRHMEVVRVLKEVGWVEESNNFLTLTEKGKEKHARFMEILEVPKELRVY